MAYKTSLRGLPNNFIGDVGSISILFGLFVCLFLLDLFIPLGVATGVPYLICVIWASRIGTRQIWGTTIIASLFVLVGYLQSPDGGEPWKVLLNRGLALLAIWATALSSARWVEAKKSLLNMNRHLEEIVRQRTLGLTLQTQVAGILRDAETWEKACPKILQVICREMIWEIGISWHIHSSSNFATCQFVCNSQPNSHASLLDMTQQATLTLENEFPPGWEKGAAFWHYDMQKNENSPRMNTAFDSQLRYRFVIPLLDHQTPIGMLEFLTSHPKDHGPGMLNSLESIATHIEQFINRETAERKIQASLRDLEYSHEALIVARDQALNSAKAKSNFLAAMSHEIRTPLNGVIGPTEMLLDEPLSPDQRELLNTILTCSRSLLQTLNDILDFSKLDYGKLPLEMIPFDPRTLLDEVLTIFAHEAEKKQMEFSGCIHSTIPSLLRGDSGRLRQILINVVGNAIKFTSTGEVTLSITSTAIDAHNTRVSIEINDTGIGISPEHLEHLFNPFHQADAGMSRKFGGTGLGLAISKQLAELMQGSINVESILGKGTRFLIAIPFQVVESPSSGSLSQSLHGRRVCVVAPHSATSQIIVQHLEFWKLPWKLVKTGSEALILLQEAQAKNQPWDLIIFVEPSSDLDVEGFNQLIANNHPKARTPIIVISGSPNSREILNVQEDGFTTCLPQPIRYQPLLKAITASLIPEMHPIDVTDQEVLHPLSLPKKKEVRKKPNKRILLVEDNVVNQKVTTRMLKNLGYQVDVAVNGQEAVTTVPHNTYDLILMDCQMPIMDGLEATRIIRQIESKKLEDSSKESDLKAFESPHSSLLTSHGSHVPIIALTANALTGDREICLQAGMDDFLSKPVGIEDLRAMLTKWLPYQDQPAQRIHETHETLQPCLDDAILENLKNLGGEDDPEFFLSVMDQFLSDLPRYEYEIQQAVEGPDADALIKAAHACKGSCRTIGACTLADTSFTLEQLGREGTVGSAQEKFQQWLREKDRTLLALQMERDKLTQEIKREKEKTHSRLPLP